MTYERGATLAEIMLAVLIVSISMLAGVRISTDAISAVTDTLYYQRATHLAADINALYATTRNVHALAPSAVPATACDMDNPCRPDDWLGWQLDALRIRASDSLPAGTLEISAPESGAGLDARLSWQAHNGKRIELAWQPVGSTP